MSEGWQPIAGPKPPLNTQVLVEMRNGVGQVCDVACYVGPHEVEGAGVEDRWLLADIRLDSKQITRWAHIYPQPPKDALQAAWNEGYEAGRR